MASQNAYVFLSDFTKDKLFVAVVSALRSFTELSDIGTSGNSLERIIDASVSIYKERKFAEFSRNAMRQLRAILCLNQKELEDKTSGFTAKKEDGIYVITSCFGEFHKYKKLYMEDMMDQEVVDLVMEAEKSTQKQYRNFDFAVCFEDGYEGTHVMYIKVSQMISEWDKNLLDIFCSNIPEAFDALHLDNAKVTSRKDIIFALGEVAEARAKVRGGHVRRISEYSRFLASKLGLNDDEVELIASGAPIHDIGKLSISDKILNKPGRLTVEEFNEVKLHASAGFEMLKNASDKVLKMAASIAISHHEKYNGAGYPYGLKGEAIPMAGRIVALADVVDALSSDSVYKTAWPFERIIELVRDERGQHFDPEIVDVLLEHMEEFTEMRNSLKK